MQRFHFYSFLYLFLDLLAEIDDKNSLWFHSFSTCYLTRCRDHIPIPHYTFHLFLAYLLVEPHAHALFPPILCEALVLFRLLYLHFYQPHINRNRQ